MKKSELNTLRDYLTELVVNTMSEEVIDAANEIWKLLDTFDVDPPSAREIKDRLGWTGPEHEPSEAFGVFSPPVSCYDGLEKKDE